MVTRCLAAELELQVLILIQTREQRRSCGGKRHIIVRERSDTGACKICSAAATLSPRADVRGLTSSSNTRSLVNIKFRVNLCKVTKTNECFIYFARAGHRRSDTGLCSGPGAVR